MFVWKSTHEAEIKALQNLVLARDAEIVDILQTNYALDRTAARYKRDYNAARDTLVDIAEMATPSCAHIGKRMAARARQELTARGLRMSTDNDNAASDGVAVQH